MTTSADWIIKGKRPTDAGFSILTRSPGAPDPHHVEDHFLRYVPGNPGGRSSKTDPAALPWVWFAPDRGHTLQASLALPSGLIDAVGRPFDYTYGFWLKPEDLLRDKPSYESIHGAMQSQLPDSTDSEPVEFQLQSINIREVAERIDIDRLMRLAATLLASPLVLITSDAIPLQRRLAEIDAIAAFLPYGFRLDLAAASWIHDGGASLRLGFSGGGLLIARLREAAIPAGSSPDLSGELARNYYERLKLLAGQVSVLTLLSHLHADFSERSFTEPETALAWLDELGRPYFIWQDVVDGIDRVEEVRQLIESNQVMPDATDDFIQHLLLLGGEHDLDRYIAPLWAQPVSERCAQVLSVAIYTRGASDLSDSYVSFAATHDELDRVVSTILQGPAALSGQTCPSGLESASFPVYPAKNPAIERVLARIHLLQPVNSIVCVLVESVQQYPDMSWDRTRAEIERSPALYYDIGTVAFELKSKPENVLGRLGLKRDNGNPAMRPLLSVIDGIYLDQAELRLFCHTYPDLVDPLVRLLLAGNREDVARDLVWEHYVEIESAAPESAWRNRVDLVFPTRDISDQARGDVLRFLGNIPYTNWITERFGTGIGTQYIDQFISAVQQLQTLDTRWRVRRAAIDALDRDVLTWSKEPWSLTVLGFLQRLALIRSPESMRHPTREGDVDPREVVLRAINSNAQMTQVPEFEWWKHELQNNPNYREAIERAEFLAEVQESLSPSKVARKCGSFLRKRQFDPSVVDTVADWLLASEHNSDPTQLSTFLMELGADLARNNVQTEQRRDVIGQILHVVIGGYPQRPDGLESWVSEMRNQADFLELIAAELARHHLNNLERDSQTYVRGAPSKSLEDLSSAGKRGMFSRFGRRS